MRFFIPLLIGTAALGCAVQDSQRRPLSGYSERVDAPRPGSCPAQVNEGPTTPRGVTPFASSAELHERVGTTVWLVGNGRLGEFGKEFVYRHGDPVVLCSERPFEDAGRVASLEMLEANEVLIKRSDGAFFNVRIHALSATQPRRSGRAVFSALDDDAGALIGAEFADWFDAKSSLANDPHTSPGADDRAKPSFWAWVRHQVHEATVVAVGGFVAHIESLTDLAQFHAFEPLIRCARSKIASEECASARKLADSPPRPIGAPRRGGTVVLSIRPILAGTVLRIDGTQVTLADGRASASFDGDGDHQVEVVAPGRRSVQVNVRVVKGETASVPVVLLPR